MKLGFLFLLLLVGLQSKTQPICTPTVSPVVIYPPNSTHVGGPNGNNTIQYLCGPNTVVHDTTTQSGCWSVYVDNQSVLYLKPMCVAYQQIWLKSNSILNLNNGSSYILVHVEVGAVINQPPGPHSYYLIIDTCSSIVFPVANCLSGIFEAGTETDVKVSPNPVNSSVTVSGGGYSSENATFQIKNNLGQVVLNKPFSPTVDISILSSGIYFLTIQNKTGSKTVKIIKE